MNKIKLITDSTCDIPFNILEEKGIDVLPLGVNFGEESYRDGYDIDTRRLYDLIKEKKELPKSSAISPMVFKETFTKYTNEGYDIIYIGIGSKISSTYANALQASSDMPNVYCIDSLNLSSAIGLQVFKIQKFVEEGLSAPEIVEKMKDITPKTECSFIIDTLEHLRKGGRCSGLTYFVGKVLNIHPTIVMNKGELKVGRISMNFHKGVDQMINAFKDKYEKGLVDPDHVMITHSFNYEEEKYIREKLSEVMPSENIMSTLAGCVISTHCGEKCIGILYIRK